MSFEFDIKSRAFRVIVLVAVVLLLIAVYFTFYSEKKCSGYECFQEAMKGCEKNVVYVNEEPEASWRYTILGTEANNCDIKVELVLAKEGTLGINKLENQGMVCAYPQGVSNYPEKELENCHGLLKEGLQKMIIDKLQTYIVEHLGSYEGALNNNTAN